MGSVTVTPETFTLVKFEAPAIQAVVERLAAIAGGDPRFEISASRLERIE